MEKLRHKRFVESKLVTQNLHGLRRRFRPENQPGGVPGINWTIAKVTTSRRAKVTTRWTSLPMPNATHFWRNSRCTES